jgi:3-oxoacyl-[acyl-carrier protein] reductase
MSRYESVKVGDKAEITHTITAGDIEKFVDLTGDDNKLHINEEYAKKTQFKKPVAHGMLGASFISTVIGTKLPGDGALWFSQSLDFLLPVRVGDKIVIVAEIKKKIERDQIIEMTTDIYNQHRQKVIAGYAKVKIVEQEELPADVRVCADKKYALVVGGSGGIGRATCIALAKNGLNIAVHYHGNRESAENVKSEVAALGVEVMLAQADIIDKRQVAEMMRKVERQFGYLTAVVICSTPKIPSIKFDLLEWSDINLHMDLNVKGCFNVVKCVLPLMEKRKYGKIVNVTTQFIESPNPHLLHYIAAKAALNGFSKALAVDLAPKGIRVNMVSPGMTVTDLISDIPEKVRLVTEARTPLRRLGRPEDVAEAISYLISPASDFITGETIRVNGGQVMI